MKMKMNLEMEVEDYENAKMVGITLYDTETNFIGNIKIILRQNHNFVNYRK